MAAEEARLCRKYRARSAEKYSQETVRNSVSHRLTVSCEISFARYARYFENNYTFLCGHCETTAATALDIFLRELPHKRNPAEQSVRQIVDIDAAGFLAHGDVLDHARAEAGLGGRLGCRAAMLFPFE